jgi:hypothetical protein
MSPPWILAIIVFLFIILLKHRYDSENSENSETHILIDWGQILDESRFIRDLSNYPDLEYIMKLELPHVNKQKLDEMYLDTPGTNTHYTLNSVIHEKGDRPLNIFYFQDKHPKYGLIRDKSRNITGHHLKRFMRDKYNILWGIHVSDCLEESRSHRKILDIP